MGFTYIYIQGETVRCTWCWIYTDSVQVNIITQRGADYSKPTNIRKDLITQFKGDNLVN